MAIYGIDNVRGGAYCRIHMPCSQVKLLNREIWNAENKCLECGSLKHYVNRCPDFVEEGEKKYALSFLEALMACIICLLVFNEILNRLEAIKR